VLAALTSVVLHYDSVDFEAIGQGYPSKKFDDDILAISNATIHGVGALARKVFAATIRAQHQSPKV
jgi:predicted membrane protein